MNVPRIKKALAAGGVFVAALVNGPTQPVITLQPQSQSVGLGANVTLNVAVSEGAPPFCYQWRFNEADLPGETNSSLLLTNVQATHAGSYTVVVMDSFKDLVTSEPARLSVVPTFTKITTDSIVTDAAHSFGCAWGDYDNDGFLDLIVGNGLGDANALYRNEGDGTFTRITTSEIATTVGDTDGCAWGDYDNDGDLDLFMANWKVASFLFRNDGGGNFTRITDGSMVNNVADSVGCAWGDYDNDGFLDLIVANDNGQNEFLYQNSGDGTFTQVFDGSIPNSGGNSFGPRWVDYDNDGLLDLFIAPGGTRNQIALFHNDGGASFSPISTSPSGETAGGVGDWGDYDNDGYLDLLVGYWRGPDGINAALYRNEGSGTFTRILLNSIVAGGASFEGMGVWGDYDNDGWLDLFAVDYDRNVSSLFNNNGDGTFARITFESIHTISGGMGWADYDNDGFLDLFVARGAETAREPNLLYHNNGNSNRWLVIKCVGAASNRSGIGAKVRIEARMGGVARWQFREIGGGNGYLGGTGLQAHFGVSDATNVDLVRIEWPSGTVQQLQNVIVNQCLVVTEPPRLQATERALDRAFQFRLTGGIGFRYSLEISSNLLLWTPWLTVTNTARTMSITDMTASFAPQRFYRAKSD